MPDNERLHHVLRIPMPRPDAKDCFVAISFDTALDQVSGAIAEAVSSHGLNFRRVDLSRPGPKWTENSPEGIRDAAVVVAVLNNKQDDASRINVNVAYELGLAHALGKPVIIIVDDKRNTPFSDIGHFYWLESHHNGLFSRKDFIAHLRTELTTVMSRLSGPYSHPLWPNATLTGADHYPSTDLLNILDDAFRYGKRIHGNFHALNASHITGLSTSAYDMLYNKDITYADALKKEFDKYDYFYNKEIRAFFIDELFLRKKAETAISDFASNKLRRCFYEIHTLVDGVQNGDKRLRDIHGIAVYHYACKDVNQNTQLYSAVKHVQASCNQIVSAADDYLVELMDIFLTLSKEYIR